MEDWCLTSDPQPSLGSAKDRPKEYYRLDFASHKAVTPKNVACSLEEIEHIDDPIGELLFLHYPIFVMTKLYCFS